MKTALEEAIIAQQAVDCGWMLMCGIIVFFMQTGFTFLETGSVRQKNYQSIMLKNVLDLNITALTFWCFGYGFAFGNVNGGIIGSKYFMGQDLEKDNKFTDWFFQFSFASTSVTIVSGALAERVDVYAYLRFSFVMAGFIYPIVVASTWGGGWLQKLGYHDYAGSGVVHITGGIAGLVGAYISGPRLGRFSKKNYTHSLKNLNVDDDKFDYEKAMDEMSDGSDSSIDQNTISCNNEGFKEVIRKFKIGQWDLLMVEEFVRVYIQNYEKNGFVPQSTTLVVLGTMILQFGYIKMRDLFLLINLHQNECDNL